jgi:hypothetical protein
MVASHEELTAGAEPTFANWSRALGQPVERKLRAMEHLHPWWFDPALPLEEICDGLPKWDAGGRRADSGEPITEFLPIVQDYQRAMSDGAVFPPLLVMEVRPAADRAALPWPLLGWLAHLRRPPAVAHDHYRILNGRHRVMAAWLGGRRHYPAFVWASLADCPWPPRSATTSEAERWWDEALAGEAEVVAVAAPGRQRGVGPVTQASGDLGEALEAVRAL